MRGGRTTVLGVVAATTVAMLVVVSAAFGTRGYVPDAVFGLHVDKTSSGNVCTLASKDECGPGEAGGEAGELAEPAGVAVNDATGLAEAAGDVYVADKGNNRVDQFDAMGNFIRAWGWGVLDAKESFEVCAASCQPGIAGSGPGQFAAAEGIAVDDSAKSVLEDPSVGDVYVMDTANNAIDKFTAEGKYLGQLTETANGALFSELHAVTVDASGNLWVYLHAFPIEVAEFSDTGIFLKSFNGGEHGAGEGIAVDSAGGVYVVRGAGQLAKYDASGTLVREFDSEAAEVSGLALNLTTNTLLADQKGFGNLALFGPFGEPASSPVETFPTEPEPLLSASRGVAENSSTAGSVYATQSDVNSVESFESAPFPEVAAADVSEAGVTLRGSINPESETVSECAFEYGEEAGVFSHVLPCSQATPFSGSTNVQLSAELSGLEARRRYYERVGLVIEGKRVTSGEREFFTATRPTIEGVTVVGVGAGQATIDAQFNPAGLAGDYRVEYGTTAGYGSATQERSVSASEAPVEVRVPLTGLQPGTVYHFDLQASNPFGDTVSSDMTFETTPVIVPRGDERVPEDVSGASSANEVYTPSTPSDAEGSLEDIPTEFPVRAAANGEAIAYIAEPGGSGGTGATGRGEGNEFLARRDPQQGWQTQDISPPPAPIGEQREISAGNYVAFSSNLAVGLLASKSPTLAASAQPKGPSGCFGLYSRDENGSYHGLFTMTQTPGECGLPTPAVGREPQNLLFVGGNAGTEGVGEYSHLLLQSPAALNKEAVEATKGGDGVDLYESVGGAVTSVNVLPGGAIDPDAVFGGPPAEPVGSFEITLPDFASVISADGNRIVWSDLVSEHIYVREDGDTTIPVSAGPARFWSATTEGATASGFDVLYTEGGAGEEELFRFNFERYTEGLDIKHEAQAAALGEAREDLVSVGLKGESAAVQGVVGVSSDDAYTYFVADGVLARNENSGGETASARTCEEAGGEENEGHLPAGKGCNLYVLHEGQVSFIATLAAKDDRLGRAYQARTLPLGDWQPELGSRTAQVTPNGDGLVFESTQQLTKYDDSSLDRSNVEHGVEIFVYEAGEDGLARLFCASCSPEGNPPAAVGSGAYLPPSINPSYMPRWISEDGNRVFFDTAEPLVPQDTNGTQDVYEWEREGTAGCAQATSVFGGCVYLLSGGSSSDLSFFEDADASGDNAFFTHRGPLGATGSAAGATDMFDSRVGGGFPEPVAVCTVACEGAPASVGSVFAPPPSVAFSGVGNFAPQQQPAKATAKQLLEKALTACRRDRRKAKRTACERQAHARYGPKQSAKKQPAKKQPAKKQPAKKAKRSRVRARRAGR
jgi:hypothetical protein